MPPVVTLRAVTKDDSRLCVCLPCDIASSSVSAWGITLDKNAIHKHTNIQT